MLKTAFIGNLNNFDLMICHWLNQRTELRYCFWTKSWLYRDSSPLKSGIRHFKKRTKRYGFPKILNEIIYYVFYNSFIRRRDLADVQHFVEAYWQKSATTQKEFRNSLKSKDLFIDDIYSENLVNIIKSNEIDIMLSMCVDIIFPEKLFSAPRLGTYLWHEGITPEYRGLHSPFWALYNREFDKLGYTFLKMGKKIDGGKIYLQGKAEGIDPLKNFHSYIGHKAVYDSLSKVEKFLLDLENGSLTEIMRPGAPSNFYTFPGFTQLLSILSYRLRRRILR